jgi:hypothetical protein
MPEETTPTEDTERMRDATGTERESATDAEENYQEKKRAADADRTQANVDAAKKAEAEKDVANSKLNRKALEALNGKEFTDSEWQKFQDAIKNVSDAGPVDVDDPSTAGSDANANNIQRAAAAENAANLPPNITEPLNRASNSIAEGGNAESFKDLSSGDRTKIQDSQNKIEAAAKDLADAIKKGDKARIKDALERISKEKKAISDILENNKAQKQKTEATEGGRDGWAWKKALAGLGKLLAALAPLGLALVALQMVADSMTGCYQYNGEDKKKIGCPSDSNHQEYCSCGQISKIYYQPTDKKTVCVSGQEIMNYPFCCGSQITDPTVPLCTDPTGSLIPGDSGYVYYGYEKYSAADVFTNGLKAAIKALEDALSQLFSILKWVAIGIGILIVLFIAFKLFSGFFQKKENEHGEYSEPPNQQYYNNQLPPNQQQYNNKLSH